MSGALARHYDIPKCISMIPFLGGPTALAQRPPPSSFPYGLGTAEPGYASSMGTNLSAYAELLGHHLRSALDLVASTLASEYLDSVEDSGLDACMNVDSPNDPGSSRPFMDRWYYYFSVPDPYSDDDSYDPTRECFHIKVEDVVEDSDDVGKGASTSPPFNHAERPKEPAAASVSTGHQGVQLEQLRELQAKLDEERGRLR